MNKIKSIPLIFCLLGLLMMNGCNRSNENVDSEKTVTVRTVKVKENIFANKREYVGIRQLSFFILQSAP